MSDDIKKCSKCKRPLPNTNEYYAYTKCRGRRYLRADCKLCKNLGGAAHYQKNRKKYLKNHSEYNKRYREESRVGYNAKRRLYNARKFAESLSNKEE